MSEKKKKLFPKLKKKLQDFLTDESGEITKKDALGVTAGASIFAGLVNISNVDAYDFTGNETTDDLKNLVNQLEKEKSDLNSLVNKLTEQGDIDNVNITNSSSDYIIKGNKDLHFAFGDGSCTVSVPAHISGIVNGHISQDPSNNISLSHGSHSSHSSGGWC